MKQNMAGVSQKSFLIRHLKKWWDLQTMMSLEWMQIEVTTRCNARCHYCPRTAYRDGWVNRDLSFENFKALLPVIAYAKRVHLQGWGEPFLHPHLFEMIALAKKTGCKVGTTTNGMLLNRRRIAQLVKSGIDHVAFSLTGIGEKNDLARSGTQYSRILRAIADLARQKEALRAETPVIAVAYLLLRSHLPEIDKLVPALAETGAKQVVISMLDFIPHGHLRQESLAPGNEAEYRELKSVFDRLEAEAEKKGLGLYCNLVLPAAKGRSCTEKPCRTLFVSSDGSVSPCAFCNIPVSKSFYTGERKDEEYHKIVFGRIDNEFLPSIWKHADYRDFRRHFGLRPYSLCQRCPKRYESVI